MSPDAARLYALDGESDWLTVISISGFQVLRWIDLSSHKTGGRSFLGAQGDRIFFRGPSDDILVFDPGTEQFRGAAACGGRPCDVAVLPGRVLMETTVASGSAGRVVLFEAGRLAPVDQLNLPLPPMEKTMAVSPDGRMGTAILGPAGKGEYLVAGWTLDPLRVKFVASLESTAAAAEFDPDGKRVWVACPGESEVVAIEIDSGNISQRLRLAGRPFQVRTERRGRTVWALCESLGSLAIVDGARGRIAASLPLRGLRGPGSRLASSPEGKLAVVPTEEGAALLNSDAGGDRYGRLEDHLELGRRTAYAAWSPLGDEVFLSDAESGAVVALNVNRGDVAMDDTGKYLGAQVRPAPVRNSSLFPLNPLFPP